MTKEWISVNEKLPDYDEEVLVFSPPRNVSIARLWEVCKCGDTEHFSDGNWCANLYEITYWMYLPSAPVKPQPKNGKLKGPKPKSKFNTSLKRSNFNFWG